MKGENRSISNTIVECPGTSGKRWINLVFFVDAVDLN
jgi:hypothetical protein